MKIRALALTAALALVFPLLALGVPAATAAAPLPGLGRAYVTELIGGTVKVIDLSTNSVIDTIPVGDSPTEATRAPDGSAVYVANQGASTVSVIDTATSTVVATIPVGAGPTGIAFSPNGATAYVANSTDDTLSVINTATRTVTATIPLPAGGAATEVAVTPNGAKVYVTNANLDTVSVVNTATNTVTANIPVGSQPYGVVVSPVANRAYVSNRATNDVTVINTATDTVSATMPVGPNLWGIDVSPDGSAVYVVSNDNFVLSEINTATNTVVATIPTTVGAPITVVVTSRRVYVSALSGEVAIIDRASRAPVGTVSIAEDQNSFVLAWGLAVVPGATPPPSATPTIATQASADNLAGSPVTDTATLSGGAGPTGTVTFRLYSDSACLNEVFTSTKALVGSTATSGTFVVNTPGTYYWRAIYTGDARNNPAANPCGASHEVVVISPFAPPAFTRTVTGDFVGPLTVNAGESVQLLNARVIGPVTVNPGGALTVTNSQISRGIVANAPGFLLICGSQVSAPSAGQALAVSNARVPIRIGDQSRNCVGNRFAGSVNLTGNGTQTFGNNIVSGNVTVNNGGPGVTLIKNNNISGTLACAGNNPPPAPTRPRQRNTAGARSGQCVGDL